MCFNTENLIKWKISFPTCSLGSTTVTTSTSASFGGAEEKQTIKSYDMPLCGVCRERVRHVVSYSDDKTYTMIFECHGEKRRVDVSLRAFLGSEHQARKHVLKSYEYLFNEEAVWQDLGEPEPIASINRSKQGLADWLAGKL